MSNQVWRDTGKEPAIGKGKKVNEESDQAVPRRNMSLLEACRTQAPTMEETVQVPPGDKS